MKHQEQTDKLSAAQMMVVRRGIKSGLTKSQISTYAKPGFTPEQMEEVRQGFLDGLKPDEIRVFADPLVNVDEMRRIRKIYQLTSEIESDQKQLTKMVKDAERRAQTPLLRNPFRRHLTR